jgi:hypothetical protein
VLVLAGLAPASRREPATTPLTEIPD